MTSFFTIPENAYHLRELYQAIRECNENEAYSKSSLSTRHYYSAATIPAAIFTAGTYAAEGIYKPVWKLLCLDFKGAGKAFVNDVANTLLCLAFAVANVVDTILGPLVGNFVYKCSPKIESPKNESEELSNKVITTVGQITSEQTKTQESIAELLKTCADTKGQLEKLQKDLLEAQKSKKTLEDELKEIIKTKENQINGLNEKLSSLNSGKRVLTNKCASLQDQLKNHTRTNQQDNQKIQSLESQIEHLKKNLKNLSKQYNEKLKELQKANRNLEEQKNDLYSQYQDIINEHFCEINKIKKENADYKLKEMNLLEKNSKPNVISHEHEITESNERTKLLENAKSIAERASTQITGRRPISPKPTPVQSEVSTPVTPKIDSEEYANRLNNLIQSFGQKNLDDLIAKTENRTLEFYKKINAAVDYLNDTKNARNLKEHYEEFKRLVGDALVVIKTNGFSEEERVKYNSKSCQDIKIKFLRLCAIWAYDILLTIPEEKAIAHCDILLLIQIEKSGSEELKRSLGAYISRNVL